jgi:hypothetical protein
MLIDIGIGRIPARNADEAKIMVDKIIRYHDQSQFWRLAQPIGICGR